MSTAREVGDKGRQSAKRNWPLQGKWETERDKTRQDNVLFGVLYSPMYIDFIQIIQNHNTNCIKRSISVRCSGQVLPVSALRRIQTEY